MPSSTSSSKLARLFKERTFLVVVIALALLSGTELALRHSNIYPNDTARQAIYNYETVQFWYAKIHTWKAEYDLVLLGDSRIYRGVSPQAMTTVLPGYRISNFGFPGAGFTSEMLARGSSLLNPASQKPILVLGVTPHSLTPHGAKNEQLHQILEQGPLDMLESRLLGGIKAFYNRYTFSDLKALFFNSSAAQALQRGTYIFHDSGWVESDRNPPDPERGLEIYLDMFKKTQVNPKYCKAVFNTVRQWTKSGIMVFGFRPPVMTPMYNLEEAESGFDHANFVEKFTQAGGIWLEYEIGSYETYDSNHLRAGAAKAFSKDLANKIKSNLASTAP